MQILISMLGSHKHWKAEILLAFQCYRLPGCVLADIKAFLRNLTENYNTYFQILELSCSLDLAVQVIRERDGALKSACGVQKNWFDRFTAAKLRSPARTQGNRPHECEEIRPSRHQDRQPHQRKRSAELQPPQSRNCAPAPRGETGKIHKIECFHCGKSGMRYGQPGCPSPRDPSDRGKAALAAYKLRVDSILRARSPHMMTAVAPAKEAHRKTYAHAASTTADPDREKAISFSMATISRHKNSAIEEEDSENDDTEIPGLAPLSESADFEEDSKIQALCPRHPPIKPLPFHRCSALELVSGLVINGELTSGLWDTAACNGNWITPSEADRLGSFRETAKVQVYTSPLFPERTFTSRHVVYLDLDFSAMGFSIL